MKKQEDRKKEKRKGESALAEKVQVTDIRNHKPKRIPQLTRRECTPRALLSGRIKKIWEVDSLSHLDL